MGLLSISQLQREHYILLLSDVHKRHKIGIGINLIHQLVYLFVIPHDAPLCSLVNRSYQITTYKCNFPKKMHFVMQCEVLGPRSLGLRLRNTGIFL